MKSLNRNWFLGVAGCLILAAGIALAEKGGNGGGGGGKPDPDDSGKPVALHGCITFTDRTGDSIVSDGAGAYCDSIDSEIGLLEFFRFHVELPKNGIGRTLSVDFGGVDPLVDLPANEQFWTLAISGHHLDEWRSIPEDSSVEWNGRFRFGKEGKDSDVIVILYGTFGGIDYGDPLIVTQTGEDVWTIEGDYAEVARQGKGNANYEVLGTGAIPFKVEYIGAP